MEDGWIGAEEEPQEPEGPEGSEESEGSEEQPAANPVALPYGEAPVVFLSPRYAQMAVVIRQSQTLVIDNVRTRDPGLTVTFDMGRLVVYPSRVYQRFGEHTPHEYEITGAAVIKSIRALPRFGNTILEVGEDMEEQETAEALLERLLAMSDDALRGEATNRKLRFGGNLDRNGMIVAILADAKRKKE